MAEHWTMTAIKAANKAAGRYWFEPGTLRFFDSHVGQTVYQGAGGVYFVSSERFHGSRGYSAPRRYTVRQFDPETGAVDTVGPFNELMRSAAIAKAKGASDGD